MMMYNNTSAFGNFRTRPLNDMWPTAQSFIDDYKSDINPTYLEATQDHLSDANCKILWGLLMARFGSDPIKSDFAGQVKLRVFTTIFAYGLTWQKQLALQSQLRALTADDLAQGTTQIHNRADHPGTAVTAGIGTTDLLTYIDSQSGTTTKRGKAEQIATVMSLLDRNITEEFISKFNNIFKNRIVSPSTPLWYESEEEEEEED